MKQSLKEKLNDLIREKGEVSYGEIAEIVSVWGYRLSTAERRLRQSESPNVEPIMGYSQRHTEYIKGWKWSGAPKKPAPKYIFEGNKVIMVIKK